MTVYDEYYLMSQIKRLEADLAEAEAQIAVNLKQAGKHFAETCRLEHDLAEAEAQIAAKDAKLDALYNERHLFLIDKTRQAQAAQIAAKDAALDALDEAHQITQQNLWQDITELRASLAGKEQEHQDFRLQNDAEWRAKLDHLKAQIAVKDAALRWIVDASYHYITAARMREIAERAL